MDEGGKGRGLSVWAGRGWARAKNLCASSYSPQTPPQETHPGGLRNTGGKIGLGRNLTREPQKGLETPAQAAPKPVRWTGGGSDPLQPGGQILLIATGWGATGDGSYR